MYTVAKYPQHRSSDQSLKSQVENRLGLTPQFKSEKKDLWCQKIGAPLQSSGLGKQRWWSYPDGIIQDACSPSKTTAYSIYLMARKRSAELLPAAAPHRVLYWTLSSPWADMAHRRRSRMGSSSTAAQHPSRNEELIKAGVLYKGKNWIKNQKAPLNAPFRETFRTSIMGDIYFFKYPRI